MDMPKHKRFRFSVAENLQVFDELFNVVRADIKSTEYEMWEGLKTLLCRNTPRFAYCSVRLLRDHTLEEIAKYKRYLEDGTGQSHAKLTTVWGEKVGKLMQVWYNYEQLVELEAAIKARNKKNNSTHPKHTESDSVDEVRNAAMSNLSVELEDRRDENEIQIDNEPVSEVESESVEQWMPVSEAANEASCSQLGRKRRSDHDVWSYLADKSRQQMEAKLVFHRNEMDARKIDQELRKEEIDLKRRKLDIISRNQDIEKQKLDLEMSKWEFERCQRQQMQQMQVATTELLTVLLKNSTFKYNGQQS